MTKGIVAGVLGTCIVVTMCRMALAAPPVTGAKSPQRGGCGLVATDEAAAILGSTPKAEANGSSCTYQVQGLSLELLVRSQAWAGETAGAYKIFQLQQGKVEEGNARHADPAMQAEASLGENAVSVRARDSYYLVFPVKKSLLEFEVRDKGKSLPSSAPEKLRDVAKKVAARQ